MASTLVLLIKSADFSFSFSFGFLKLGTFLVNILTAILVIVLFIVILQFVMVMNVCSQLSINGVIF